MPLSDVSTGSSRVLEVRRRTESRKFDRFTSLSPSSKVWCGWAEGWSLLPGGDCCCGWNSGTQYTSEHFLNALKYWALTPSIGYVAGQPETNGAAERFKRTLKAPVIRRRVFRDAAELRSAVGEFIDR